MLWWVMQGIHQALVCAGHNVASQGSLEIFKFLDSVHLSTLTAWVKSMKTEKRHFSCYTSVGHLVYQLGTASLSPT